MDLLFQRYASPFIFIDGMLETGRFCEFVSEFVNAKLETDEWEIYLHKVWDKSFSDFKEAIKNNSENRLMTERQIEATVQNSANILSNFSPEQ
jgi:hypothetical protein